MDSTCTSGLRWRVRPQKHFATAKARIQTNSRYAGKQASTLWTCPRTGKQYFRLGVAGGFYFAHRVVYALHHGIDLSTDVEIDHEDGNGINNAVSNLRISTRNENNQNVKLTKTNTSGIKGVSFHKASKMWVGTLGYNGKRYNLGYSHSREVMAEMVRELREKLHKEFANHG